MRWAWGAAFVVATFLSFPHPVPFTEGRVLDLGLFVSWLAPLCLVRGLGDLPPWRAARWAFAATVAAHAAVLHFIYVVTVVYGHAPAVVGVIAPVLLAMYAGLAGALFGAGWSALYRAGLANAWTGALLWTVLDHFKSFFLTGWPWGTMGYAQHLNPALMGLPQWTGVYGLSFVVVLGGLALGEAVSFRRRGQRPPVATFAALAAVVGLHGLGLALANDPDALHEGDPRIRIAAIQGNIDQGVKWNEAWVERTFETYEELSRKAAGEGAALIVWPETAVPGALESDRRQVQRLERLARETGAVLVVGSVGVEIGPTGRLERFFDSAFFVEPDRGLRRERYDKTHLVPFGEYVPLREWIGRFVGAVASGIASGDVTPGDEPWSIDLRIGAADGGKRTVRVGVPICYELLFPDGVRRFVSDGGGILLGITNDAWYGRTGAPYQFLAMTAMRSAETAVYGVRAANTGVSAVIDSGGWVREATPIFEEAYRVAEVPIRSAASASGGTFYVRHGDAFAWACWVVWIAVAALAWMRFGDAASHSEPNQPRPTWPTDRGRSRES